MTESERCGAGHHRRQPIPEPEQHEQRPGTLADRGQRVVATLNEAADPGIADGEQGDLGSRQEGRDEEGCQNSDDEPDHDRLRLGGSSATLLRSLSISDCCGSAVPPTQRGATPRPSDTGRLPLLPPKWRLAGHLRNPEARWDRCLATPLPPILRGGRTRYRSARRWPPAPEEAVSRPFPFQSLAGRRVELAKFFTSGYLRGLHTEGAGRYACRTSRNVHRTTTRDTRVSGSIWATG